MPASIVSAYIYALSGFKMPERVTSRHFARYRFAARPAHFETGTLPNGATAAALAILA